MTDEKTSTGSNAEESFCSVLRQNMGDLPRYKDKGRRRDRR